MPNKETLTRTLIRFALTLFASFIFAAACYDILLFFGFKPFAGLYRMYCYHWLHPFQFMFIPCFVFSVLAVAFSGKFKKASIPKQIGFTVLIIFLTILISSPLGGMLWHLHDMLAGYFPKNWFLKLVKYGFREGMQLGWIIIICSVPYNIIGMLTSFFILRTISDFPQDKKDNVREESSLSSFEKWNDRN